MSAWKSWKSRFINWLDKRIVEILKRELDTKCQYCGGFLNRNYHGDVEIIGCDGCTFSVSMKRKL